MENNNIIKTKMKTTLLLLLLIPFAVSSQYNYQVTGPANYHTQYRGGIGANTTLKAPVSDSSTPFDFDMKGLIRVNSSGNWLEFHNGIGWTKALDVNTVFTKSTVGLPNVDNTSDLNKPLSTATTNALLSKFNSPSGTTSQYLNGLGNPVTFPAIPNYTAGSGLSISSNVISNTAPDQTVSITGANGLTSSGTYPNFTISRKRQETYSGTTNASGNYTVTFGTAYSVAPNIQANIINGTDTQNIRTTTVTTTGFTVLVRNRTDVVGLLPSWANVNGANVDVLITEK